MAKLGEFEVAARREEGVEPDTFDFCGEAFTVSDQVGIIPLGRFAKAAQSGLEDAEMEGLAAMIDLLEQVVVDEDRQRFLALASKHRAGADDLFPIVQAVIEAQSGNPTVPSSGSSDGPSTTGPSSPVSPTSVDTVRLADTIRGLGDPRKQGLVPIEDAGLQLLG